MLSIYAAPTELSRNFFQSSKGALKGVFRENRAWPLAALYSEVGTRTVIPSLHHVIIRY